MMMGPLFFFALLVGSLLFQVFHGFLFLICFLWLGEDYETWFVPLPLCDLLWSLLFWLILRSFPLCVLSFPPLRGALFNGVWRGFQHFFSLKNNYYFTPRNSHLWWWKPPSFHNLWFFTSHLVYFLVHPQTLICASTGA